MAIAAVLVALLATVFSPPPLLASAQSIGSCMAAATSLSPCLGYLYAGSTTPPTAACCAGLARLVQTQTECICTAAQLGAVQLGVSMHQSRTLALSGSCKVTVPPLSHCNGGVSSQGAVAGPAAAAASGGVPPPMQSASDDEPSSLSPSASAAPTVSKTVPTASSSAPSGPAQPAAPLIAFFSSLLLALYGLA